MIDLDPYHRKELAIVRDKSDPRRHVPPFDCTGLKVLDIGCGSGQTLTADELVVARERHGIDVDGDAVARGQAAFPELALSVAAAEAVPYPDRSFDLVISRVALPYANLPVAFAEAYRVLKPGGRLWITLHPWSMERKRLADAALGLRLRGLLSRAPVVANSLVQHVAGRPLPLPEFVTRETFQTPRGLRLMLQRTGFEGIDIAQRPTLMVIAVRPGAC